MKCISCDKELEKISETSVYCANCDSTFNITKGKVTVDAPSKGKLQQIEESLAELQLSNQKMKELLFGNREGDLW